jgi:hypothetical protein
MHDIENAKATNEIKKAKEVKHRTEEEPKKPGVRPIPSNF